MSMKSILFSLTFLAALPMSYSQANTCDDRVASGKYTEAEIEDCVKKFGASEAYKEYLENKKLEKAAGDKQIAKEKNIEFKKFSQKEIEDLALGPVFAVRLEWKNGYYLPDKDKRLTYGDTLCEYLGYQKAIASGFSEKDINSVTADQKGFMIKTGLFGSKKEPVMYESAGDEYTVRKYTEITCAKAISKKIKGTQEELEKLVESTNFTSEQLNAPKDDKKKSVNDDKRENKFMGGATPNGPQIPDYMKDDKKTGDK